MRADGYCFDETDHSLILLISDFQDSKETDKLTRTRVDELYWRLYYFLVKFVMEQSAHILTILTMC